MNSTEIKTIFHKVFNDLPNPVFRYPQMYFEKDGKLYELASAEPFISPEWKHRVARNPIHILDGLFMSDKLHLTWLVKKDDWVWEEGNTMDFDNRQAFNLWYEQ